MARPAPGTMNAQYQEMTNEYLKVSDSNLGAKEVPPPRPFQSAHIFRTKKSSQSQVYHLRATQGKEWCRASPDVGRRQVTTNDHLRLRSNDVLYSGILRVHTLKENPQNAVWFFVKIYICFGIQDGAR